eukprot:COSAG02_NODE_4897_length_4851_cov_49.777357_1_plen_79_part_00
MGGTEGEDGRSVQAAYSSPLTEGSQRESDHGGGAARGSVASSQRAASGTERECRVQAASGNEAGSALVALEGADRTTG